MTSRVDEEEVLPLVERPRNAVYGSIPAKFDGQESLPDEKPLRNNRCYKRGGFIFLVVVSGIVGVWAVVTHQFTTTTRTSSPELSLLTEAFTSEKGSSAFDIPFPKVDRVDYGDDVSKIIDTNLFHPTLLDESSSRRTFVFPFPTGAFWVNFVLDPTSDRGISYPVAVYPYAYKWAPGGFFIVSYPAMHRKTEPKMIHDYFFPDLTLGSVEEATDRYVTHFDALSVTLRFATSEDNYWESYLVPGSPFMTFHYQDVTPTIRAMSIFQSLSCPEEEISSDKRSGVCNPSDDSATTFETRLEGTRFVLKTLEGAEWMVFTSEPLTLVFDTLSKTTLQTDKPFNGTIRLAIIPRASSSNMQSGVQWLVDHAGVYPTGGDVSWSFRDEASHGGSSDTLGKSKRVANVHFKFKTKSMNSNQHTNPELLMLALPHHAMLLPNIVKVDSNYFDLTYQCIKGDMQPVLGSSWSLREPLPSLGIDGDSGSNSDEAFLEPSIRQRLLESLNHDVLLALPVPNENIYGYGKQIARLAQLLHILNRLRSSKRHRTSTADEETDMEDENISILFNSTLRALQTRMEILLDGSTDDKLVYDSNLGGLVTSDGLSDTMADFGNGRYNDHHFHYGYTLYAAAILGHLNHTFMTEYQHHVDALYYDIANSVNAGSESVNEEVFFPMSRHKSWFDGHSFASGLFPFGNGKSQESSSEAVNAYYGAYLWSLARNGALENPDSDSSASTDFARLLLATEIRGAKTYWHMVPSSADNTAEDTPLSLSTVYNDQFSENYMVGNLGMLDAISSTWFGTEKLYVHMINFIPVTSVTGELFAPAFVQVEQDNVIKELPSIEMAWRGYTVCNQAIVDPNKSWCDAQSLISGALDAALSESQVLYWIATRKGFDSSIATTCNVDDQSGTSGSGASSPATNDSDASCSHHPGCSHLIGLCCPASNGSFLNCCDAAGSDNDQTDTSDSDASSPAINDSDDASCSNHPGCSSLIGNCCPASNGVFLGCCNATGETSSNNDQAAEDKDSNTTTTTNDSNDASCSNHQGCSSLIGLCCPASNGNFLDCCSAE